MAKGEARYSSEGKQVVRFDNKPIPIDDYTLELKEEGLEVKKSEEKGPDAIPYINSRFAAEGTAASDGGKNRLVFHKFFLSMKPGSDGIIMPERGGGIVEFCRANGEEADFAVKTLKKSDGTEEEYFDPEEVLEYLQGKTGNQYEAHVGIEPGKDRAGNAIKGHPGNNKITHWNLQPAVASGKEAKGDNKGSPLKKAAKK